MCGYRAVHSFFLLTQGCTLCLFWLAKSNIVPAFQLFHCGLVFLCAVHGDRTEEFSAYTRLPAQTVSCAIYSVPKNPEITSPRMHMTR